MQNKALKNLTAAALIAALYTALTLIVAPLSFGPVQIRLSEALTVLPAVCPPAVWGLSLGCFLSNLIGFLMGANPLGLIDSAIGTLATLLAAVCVYYMGKALKGKGILYLAPLPPIIFNGIIIGLELSYFYIGDMSFVPVLLTCVYVAIGEILPCYIGSFVFLKSAREYFKKFF
jgi:uncharacterized membrane protein